MSPNFFFYKFFCPHGFLLVFASLPPFTPDEDLPTLECPKLFPFFSFVFYMVLSPFFLFLLPGLPFVPLQVLRLVSVLPQFFSRDLTLSVLPFVDAEDPHLVFLFSLPFIFSSSSPLCLFPCGSCIDVSNFFLYPFYAPSFFLIPHVLTFPILRRSFFFFFFFFFASSPSRFNHSVLPVSAFFFFLVPRTQSITSSL